MGAAMLCTKVGLVDYTREVWGEWSESRMWCHMPTTSMAMYMYIMSHMHVQHSAGTKPQYQ